MRVLSLALISGKRSRMWAMRVTLRVLARKWVPQRGAILR